jgi:hypothetical protein
LHRNVGISSDSRQGLGGMILGGMILAGMILGGMILAGRET